MRFIVQCMIGELRLMLTQSDLIKIKSDQIQQLLGKNGPSMSVMTNVDRSDKIRNFFIGCLAEKFGLWKKRTLGRGEIITGAGSNGEEGLDKERLKSGKTEMIKLVTQYRGVKFQQSAAFQTNKY